MDGCGAELSEYGARYYVRKWSSARPIYRLMVQSTHSTKHYMPWFVQYMDTGECVKINAGVSNLRFTEKWKKKKEENLVPLKFVLTV